MYEWQANKETRGQTYKVELIGEDPEESLTVQSEHDGEVGAHRAPHKHMVDKCPEACVKSDLHIRTHRHIQKDGAAQLIYYVTWYTVASFEDCLYKSSITHLYTDHNNQGCCCSDSEGLVVSKRLSSTLSGIWQDSIGDKKQHHWCVDALGDAYEELSLVEEEVELSRFIKFRILQTSLLRNILQ